MNLRAFSSHFFNQKFTAHFWNNKIFFLCFLKLIQTTFQKIKTKKIEKSFKKSDFFPSLLISLLTIKLNRVHTTKKIMLLLVKFKYRKKVIQNI